MRVNECRVSVRDVRGSAPRPRSDASLTHCPVEVDSEMCPEMRLASRDVPRKIYTIRIWRTLEHRKCPRFAPRARNSPRVPEIRVACPRFALQRHRVMTNLPTFSLSLPLEIPSFFGTLIEIYIYIIYFTFNTPLYFGRRNTRLGYFLGHFRCSSDRQIRIVYIFKTQAEV